MFFLGIILGLLTIPAFAIEGGQGPDVFRLLRNNMEGRSRDIFDLSQVNHAAHSALAKPTSTIYVEDFQLIQEKGGKGHHKTKFLHDRNEGPQIFQEFMHFREGSIAERMTTEQIGILLRKMVDSKRTRIVSLIGGRLAHKFAEAFAATGPYPELRIQLSLPLITSDEVAAFRNLSQHANVQLLTLGLQYHPGRRVTREAVEEMAQQLRQSQTLVRIRLVLGTHFEPNSVQGFGEQRTARDFLPPLLTAMRLMPNLKRMTIIGSKSWGLQASVDPWNDTNLAQVAGLIGAGTLKHLTLICEDKFSRELVRTLGESLSNGVSRLSSLSIYDPSHEIDLISLNKLLRGIARNQSPLDTLNLPSYARPSAHRSLSVHPRALVLSGFEKDFSQQGIRRVRFGNEE